MIYKIIRNARWFVPASKDYMNYKNGAAKDKARFWARFPGAFVRFMVSSRHDPDSGRYAYEQETDE